MEALPIVWWPTWCALVVGLMGGAVLLACLPRRLAQGLGPSDALAGEQQAELQSLLAALRELEERAPSMDAAFVTQERGALEGQAKALLQRLETHAQAPKRPRQPLAEERLSPVVRYFVRRPQLQGALWGAGTMAVAAFLWVTVNQGSKAETAAMAPMAGGPAAGAAGPVDAEATRVELDGLKERLLRDPNDVEALLRVAHLALRAQQFEEAQAFNDRAMELMPDSLEGLTHRAVMAAKDGDGASADAGLDAVLRKDPGFAEAWFFRGMLSMQAGNMDKMREAFEQFIRVGPNGAQKDRVRAMLGQSKTN